MLVKKKNISKNRCYKSMIIFDRLKFYFVIFRWKELTTVKELFRVRIFPGHHNFHAECGPQVLSCLKEDFNKVISISQMN
jgi:hypothetical protein